MWVTLGIILGASIAALLAVAVFWAGLPWWFALGLLGLAAWTAYERLDDVREETAPQHDEPEECDACMGTGMVLMPWPGQQAGAYFIKCPACQPWDDP